MDIEKNNAPSARKQNLLITIIFEIMKRKRNLLNTTSIVCYSSLSVQILAVFFISYLKTN